MRKLISRIHGGQGGFTLIELLVVIAILGVIAAIVALNVGTFFGRGTLQAANTELHQVQTAIIAAMADAEAGSLTANATLGNFPYEWSGGTGVIYIDRSGIEDPVDGENYWDAAHYVYGPLRATYVIQQNGTISTGTCNALGQWGEGIIWDALNQNWRVAVAGDY